jgi:O-antigen/teichoic acid export membrane protein
LTPSPPFAQSRIAGATAWRTAYLVIQGGASVVLFGLLAHTMDPGPFAAAGVALGVLVIAQALGDFGLSQAAVSVLPARLAPLDVQNRERVLAGAAMAYLAAAVLAGGISLAAALALVPGPAQDATAIVAPAAAATVLVAGADGLLRATGRFGLPVALVTCSRVAAFAGFPAALIFGTSSAACAGVSIGTVVGSLPAIAYISAHARKGHPADARAFARAAMPLGLSQFFIVGATRLNTIVVGALDSLRTAVAFEAAWRLYQLGQYAIGALATAVAPFAGNALGARQGTEFLALTRRTMTVVVAGSAIGAVVLFAARNALAAAAFGGFGPVAARAVVPLAIVFPLAAAGFVGTYVVSASDEDRRHLIWAYAAGAALNLSLVLVLVPSQGALGATIACASGLVLAHAWVLWRYARILRRVRAAVEQPVRQEFAWS